MTEHRSYLHTEYRETSLRCTCGEWMGRNCVDNSGFGEHVQEARSERRMTDSRSEEGSDVMRDDAHRIWSEIESHPYLPGEVEDPFPPDRAEELAMIDPDMAELVAPTPVRSRTAVELPMSVQDLKPFIWKTLDALEVAVPLRQAGATASLPLRQQQELGDDFQRHVDALYGGGKLGTAGYAFNRLAEVLANLSHAPGGVNFMGLHWCTDHAVCEDPPELDPVVPVQRRPIVDVPLPDVIPARPTDTRTTTQEANDGNA